MKNNLIIAGERVKSLSANFNYKKRSVDSVVEYLEALQDYKEELLNTQNYAKLNSKETDKYISDVQRYFGK